jgi:hypothetical protein
MLLRNANRQRLSSVSDVDADTAMSVVVIQSLPSMYSRRDDNHEDSRAAQEQEL